MVKKFRCWDKKSEKFYYFNGIFNHVPYIETSAFPQYKSIKKYLTLGPPQQFVGLVDGNGKDVYEGDIIIQLGYKKFVMNDDTPKEEIYRDIVTMDRFPCYWLKGETFGFEGEDLISAKECKVIGNIYENPDGTEAVE
jgi:uncharacterized phage protein (TIGR01671 family)